MFLLVGVSEVTVVGHPVFDYGESPTNESSKTLDYTGIAIKTVGITNDVIGGTYEIQEQGIIHGSKMLKSARGVSTLGKHALKVTPFVGGGLVVVDNFIDIKETGQVQTTNVMDVLVYGTILGVGLTVGAGPALIAAAGYGVYQLWDVYNNKQGSNYINKNFNINGN